MCECVTQVLDGVGGMPIPPCQMNIFREQRVRFQYRIEM